jgi:RND family efflux transporter MFP subunit
LELQAQVPAIQLPQVQIGATAKIYSDSDRPRQLAGRVREIAPLVNAQSRQARVKIDCQTPPCSGLECLPVPRLLLIHTGIAIPAKAVVAQPEGTSTVFVLTNEGKVQARPVEVGEILNDGRVEIKNGLKAGDRVIVAGAGYLKDGDRVRVVGKG